MSRQSFDLRDVVKDSMYREARGLPRRPTTEETSLEHAVGYREPNWYFDEPRVFPRSKSHQFNDDALVYKDYPRFSYDGRETNRLSFESGATPKQLKETSGPPFGRREGYGPVSVGPDSRSIFPSRPPGVVAKLMGLEALPDLGSIRARAIEDVGPWSKPSRGTGLCGPKAPVSSREPTSPCWKNHDTKPITRFPMEPAPWKQRDGHAAKSPPFSSVHRDMEERLKYLQFTQSGKHLRALKQVFEAMGDRRNPSFTKRGPDLSTSYAPNGSNWPYGSPIVIMKPAKPVERSGPNASSVAHEESPVENGKIFSDNKTGEDPIVESTRQDHAAGFRRQRSAHESTTGSPARSRVQHKSLEPEGRSRLPKPLTDSSKPMKQSNKQKSKSGSPGGRRRPKGANLHDIGGESRDSNRKKPLISREVTASECSEETDSKRSCGSVQEKSILPLREDESPGAEYASPVSVLDDAVHMDDSTPTVKHMPNFSKDDASRSPSEKPAVTNEINREKLKSIDRLIEKLKRLNSGHDEARNDYIACLGEHTGPDHRYVSEILLASGLLLRDLATFQFHPSGHPINPDLFAVLEQTRFKNLDGPGNERLQRKVVFDAVNELLAGKLGWLVPSVETWWSRRHGLAEKVRDAREVMREVGSEIEELAAKRRRGGGDDPEDGFWREIVADCGESWVDLDGGETAAVALVVERMIFKELVKEVVNG